jgi:hypothetical protein
MWVFAFALGMLAIVLPRCYAQAGEQGAAVSQARLGFPVALRADANAAANESAGGGATARPAPGASDADVSNAMAKELEALKARIEQLELQLARRAAPTPAAIPEPVPAASPTSLAAAAPEAKPEQPAPAEPFAFADWTWLNGTPRNKDTVWDSKFFTPEIRFDANYVHSFNKPKDDSLGGSTEIFRSNEVQLEQISFGGDFHWQDVRGRVLTMGGMFATTTPRNDASVARGQWDLRGAYKYFSEAYGGYHFNVNHGLNVDAGIFVSYIGLFSYYNFDNWAYQPSFVSSNTPWFFNGLRIQWFPTAKLKIEPWIINGWQSYARFGGKPGLGGQILWRPKGWISLVFNNYGMGEDTLGNGNGHFGRSRIHTDDSVEVKYYDKPSRFLDKMAFSLTGDLGCEYGGPVSQGLNVNCHHNTATSHKQTFAGWMAYNRFWFNKDHNAITVGYGVMDNPGRYLVLLPPINGADAIYGSPYFTQNPGDPYKGWDTLVTYDWMPRQYITFRSEFGYRHANVPYWTGAGGITPPGGNTTGLNGSGIPGQLVPGTTFAAGPTLSATPGYTCVAGATGWCPDLRKDEPSARLAIMVKF